jgi:outer membrane protein TolC
MDHAARFTVVAVLASAAILGGGGCTSLHEYVHNGFKVGPNYVTPDVLVAEHWIDERERKESDHLADWWTVFNDSVLNALIQDAHQQNLTLREAGLRVLQARDQLAIVQGRIFPQQQNAFGDYRHTQTTGTGPGKYFDTWDTGLTLAWELDFWGRFRRAILQADAQLDRSVEDYDDVLVILLGEVASNYVQLRVAEQQIMVTRDNTRLMRKALAATQQKVREGVRSTTAVDQYQAESNLRATEAQLPAFEIIRRQARNRLCVLLGRPPVDLREDFEIWSTVDQRKDQYTRDLDALIAIREKLSVLVELPAGEHLRVDDLWEVGQEIGLRALKELKQNDLLRGEELLKEEYLRRLRELREMEKSHEVDLGQKTEDPVVAAELKTTDELLRLEDKEDAIGELLKVVDLWRRKNTVYVPVAPTDVAAGIPADLVRRRPDVRRAERDVAAQAEQIGIALTDLYPAITIRGTMGYAAGQFPDMFASRAFNGSVGPSFQWNLLNYGRLVNNVRLQDAKLRELVVRYQQIALQANAEVEDGLVLFWRSQERTSDLRKSLETSMKAVDDAMRLYELTVKGVPFDFNRLSTVQQDLVLRGDSLAQSQGQIAQGLIQVYRGLGGGWEIRLGNGAYGVDLPAVASDESEMVEGIPTPAAEVPLAPPKLPAPAGKLLRDPKPATPAAPAPHADSK